MHTNTRFSFVVDIWSDYHRKPKIIILVKKMSVSAIQLLYVLRSLHLLQLLQIYCLNQTLARSLLCPEYIKELSSLSADILF